MVKLLSSKVIHNFYMLSFRHHECTTKRAWARTW